MTRATAIIIELNPDVFATSIGPDPDGKYGIYIGIEEMTPSGSPRPRVLVTSNMMFDTSEEAIDAGQNIIAEIRGGGTHIKWAPNADH